MGCGREVLNLVYSFRLPPSTVLLLVETARAEAVCPSLQLLEEVEPPDEQSQPRAECHPYHGLLHSGEPQWGEGRGSRLVREVGKVFSCPGTSFCFSPPAEISRA